jgi:hypothetical protein
MSSTKPLPIQRDWISKSLAGAVLGLALALLASGLLAVLLADMPLPLRGQLMMWLVPPVWLGIWSGVYFFASGLRAWLWLGAATTLCAGLLLALRSAS